MLLKKEISPHPPGMVTRIYRHSSANTNMFFQVPQRFFLTVWTLFGVSGDRDKVMVYFGPQLFFASYSIMSIGVLDTPQYVSHHGCESLSVCSAHFCFYGEIIIINE